LIGDLSVAIHNINDRQALEGTVRIEYINPLIILHYDYDFNSQLGQDGKTSIIEATDDYEKSHEIIPFHFKSIEKLDRQATVNALGFYCFNALNSTRTLHFKRYSELNAEVLKLLRKDISPEINIMEAHHHDHIEKKRRTHYFRKFFVFKKPGLQLS
jgi:hypothetical protein